MSETESYESKGQELLMRTKTQDNRAEGKGKIETVLRSLWRSGFTDLTHHELDAYFDQVPAPVKAPALQWPSTPRQPVVSGIFGSIDNPEWLLNDPATRRSALFLVRWAKASATDVLTSLRR